MTALIAIPIESRRHRDIKKALLFLFPFISPVNKRTQCTIWIVPLILLALLLQGYPRHGKGYSQTLSLVIRPFFLFWFFFFLVVSLGSRSRGRDVTVYVKDINQPSLLTPFHSVLVSVSVFITLSTLFHSMNSLDNSPFSHTILPVSSLP